MGDEKFVGRDIDCYKKNGYDKYSGRVHGNTIGKTSSASKIVAGENYW